MQKREEGGQRGREGGREGEREGWRQGGKEGGKDFSLYASSFCSGKKYFPEASQKTYLVGL